MTKFSVGNNDGEPSSLGEIGEPLNSSWVGSWLGWLCRCERRSIRLPAETGRVATGSDIKIGKWKKKGGGGGWGGNGGHGKYEFCCFQGLLRGQRVKFEHHTVICLFWDLLLNLYVRL